MFLEVITTKYFCKNRYVTKIHSIVNSNIKQIGFAKIFFYYDVMDYLIFFMWIKLMTSERNITAGAVLFNAGCIEQVFSPKS